MNSGEAIVAEMRALANEAEAVNLMRFFKTAPGQYGEGDRFLGIRVPTTRAMVKQYRHAVDIEDVSLLLASDYHEIRLAGFLLLIELYNQAKKRKDVDRQHEHIQFYLANLERGNNWDLVDLVAPKLLGDWLIDRPHLRPILDRLAAQEGHLWQQRVAVVASHALIRHGQFDDTLRIIETLMHHPHDLIHKACGWMLREVGKHGGRDRLIGFLDRYASIMPRTMLRYSIEHFPHPLRVHYMTL